MQGLRIVAPDDETVLNLESIQGPAAIPQADHYVEHGVFHRGESASSAPLKDFKVSVNAVLRVDARIRANRQFGRQCKIKESTDPGA